MTSFQDSWAPDILGPDYEALTIDLGTDPEGESDVQATLVRYRPSINNPVAVLWIPGLSDYFFHKHVAEKLAAAGFAVYGIDLRKCARSHREGQRWHYSEDLAHYFPDLDTALGVLAETHTGVVPIAHSTGGLVAALWLDYLRRDHPHRHSLIRGVILNSPWLDMMFPAIQVASMRALAMTLGRVFPGLRIQSGGFGAYSTTIKRWDFDRTFKPEGGHTKHLGWLRAIFMAQDRIHKGTVDVGVPVLTLVSSASYLKKAYSPEAESADAVLDVEQIRRWAPTLGSNVTVHTVRGALHDVFLSQPHALENALDRTSTWLSALD